MTYIVKFKRGPRGAATVEDLKVRHGFKTKTRYRESPIGTIGVSEITGEDRSQFRVQLGGEDVRRSDGTRQSSLNQIVYCKPDPKDVKSKVRKMRPEEAEEIAAQDELIQAAIDNLRALRDRRDEMVRDAFGRGHVVTVKELREIAEAAASAQAHRDG